MECEKTAKGHKAAPLCTPLGLFLQSAAIVEHGKLLTYTCMLLYWQFNTKPKCDKQKVLQKAAKTPQTCTARRESRYSYTATIGTVFHIQHRSIQTKVDKVTPTTIEALTPISAQRPTSNTEEYKNKPTRSHIPTTKKFSKKSPRGVQRGRGFTAPLRFSFFPQKEYIV